MDVTLPTCITELALLGDASLSRRFRVQLLNAWSRGAQRADLLRLARRIGMKEAACAALGESLGDERWSLLLEQLHRRDVLLLRPGRTGYPPLLEELRHPPDPLYARGRVELGAGEAVALVGGRKADEEAREWTFHLADELATHGLVVVSGAALGIDGAAHRGAGAARTIAVLGCGLDAGYPAPHRGLLEQIGREGLLLSEWPPWTGAEGFRFPRRNRIIAGLSRAVVVCMAAERSGALNTAGHALEEGREVMACPGHPEDPHYAGCLKLLREGARPVRGSQDLLEDLGELAFLDVKRPALSTSREPPVDSPGRRIWDLLEQPLQREELALRAGEAPGALAALLMGLELEGWLRSLPGDRWRRAR